MRIPLYWNSPLERPILIVYTIPAVRHRLKSLQDAEQKIGRKRTAKMAQRSGADAALLHTFIPAWPANRQPKWIGIVAVDRSSNLSFEYEVTLQPRQTWHAI